MVIKLSFSVKVGRKRRPTAGKRVKIHSINVKPKCGDKGAERGKNVFAKRYTRCDGESKREYLRMRPVLYTGGQITLFNMIGCYVT